MALALGTIKALFNSCRAAKDCKMSETKKKAKKKKSPTKPKTGRPPKSFDYDLFVSLCEIMCTQREIANVLHTTVDTLDVWCQREHGDRFSTLYKKHIDGGKMSLRRAQHTAAQKGNASMLIWLGKQHLGQTDQPIDETMKEVYKPLESLSA